MWNQHAAHEKILYERLMKQINSREVASQGLLMPFVINVDPVVESMLEDETIIDAFAPQGCNYNGAGKTDSQEYDLWTINEEI